MLPRLLDTKAAGARCVWVEAVHIDSVTPQASTREDPGPWAAAWDWLMMRANEHRDALRRHLTGGLVFAVADEWKPRVRNAAPDLWSVRSVVLDVPGRVLSGGTAPSRAGDLAGNADVFDADVDVDFELAEMRRIKQTPRYSRQSRVPVFLRASERLLAGRRTAEASKVAREAVELLRSEQRSEQLSQDLLRKALTLEGYAAWIDGDLAVADARFEEAVGLWRVRVARSKTERSLHDLSMGLDRLGAIRGEAGDLGGATMALEESVALCRRLVPGTSSSQVLRDLSAGLARLGDVRRRSGNLFDALAAFEESVVLSRRIVNATPQWRRDLSTGLDGLGLVLAEMGNLVAATAAFEESVKICRELVELDENPTTLNALFVSLEWLGRVRKDNGDLLGVVDTVIESIRRRCALWMRMAWGRVFRRASPLTR